MQVFDETKNTQSYYYAIKNEIKNTHSSTFTHYNTLYISNKIIHIRIKSFIAFYFII